MLINKKRNILFFISLIGIVVVSLIMVSTYAYQTVQTEYEEGSDSDLNINVANLDVSYTASNKIELNNMPLLPNYKTADYLEFTIDSTKSTETVAYTISLTNLEYNSKLATSAFKYTLVLINDDGTLDMINNGDFSELNGDTFDIKSASGNFHYIKTGGKQKLRLYLWLKDSEVTSELESSSQEKVNFKGYITITSLFANDTEDSNLSNMILTDSRVNKNWINNVTTNDNNELGLYESTDDYGKTYYYKGLQRYNYVDFAGFTWRVIRVNGDGTIRLALEGTLNTVKKRNDDGTYEENNAGAKAYYNLPLTTNRADNAYVGYMYGLIGMTEADNVNKCLFLEGENIIDEINTYTTKEDCENNSGKWTTSAYEATHVNLKSSNQKEEIDKFYKNYLIDYSEYIADTVFCSEKNNYSGVGYGNNPTNYRISSKVTKNFVCAPLSSSTTNTLNSSDSVFSRYTVNSYTLPSGAITNGDLTYPIGAITETIVNFVGKYNINENYLFLPSDNYWTMTPFSTTATYAISMRVSNEINPSTGLPRGLVTNYVANGAGGVRPVINLKADIALDYGIGTKNNPYIVRLPKNQ